MLEFVAVCWLLSDGSKKPGLAEPAFGEEWTERGSWRVGFGVGGEVGTSLIVDVEEFGKTVKPELTIRASERCDEVEDADDVEGVRVCWPMGGGGFSGERWP